MSTKITMPQLGESIHEGTIGKWLKQPGEPVEKYEAIVEIITDKVNAEIPSPVDGTLTAILVQEGTTVEIGAVLAEMEESVAEAVTSQYDQMPVEVTASQNGANSYATPEKSSIAGTPWVRQSSIEEEPTGSFPAGRAVAGWYEEKSILDGTEDDDEPAIAARAKYEKPYRYSPSVRRLAEEHHLDLAALNLTGSGAGGRITRDDVLNYLEQQRTRQSDTTPAKPSQPQFEPVAVPAVPTRYEPVITAAMRAAGIEENRRPTPVPATPTPQQFPTTATTAAFAPASQPAPAPIAIQPAPVVPQPAPAPTPGAVQSSGPAYTAEMFGQNGEEVVALTPMRKAIAEHMTRSKQTTPHAWTIVEVDMTALVQHRERIKDEFRRREGVGLTYFTYMLMAVVKGLRQFPQLNATWSPERGGIVVKRELNLGVAVDVPDGLIVPVIHQADEKSLVGMARKLDDLVTRARDKKLTLADVQGGTFTVNNPGAFGSVLSYPIINQPQAGIITMETIVKRPVVITDATGNDSIAIRSIMNMCLSFDHRVVDGAQAGRFLQFVKQWLETEAPKVNS